MMILAVAVNSLDIGECLRGIHNCSQLCVQLDEGFQCDCSDGYELGDDGVTCEGNTWSYPHIQQPL